MNIMILGCGQLSQMLAIEGKKLDHTFTFVCMEGESTDCIDGMGQIINWSPGMPTDSLLEAADVFPDVITVERESIDYDLLVELSSKTKVYPGPESVSYCQNRLNEKQALEKIGIPVTPWQFVNSKEDLESAVKKFGYPIVLKATRDGYDGKNQWHLRNSDQLKELIETEEPKDWIAEPMIDFQTEASIIAARSSNGEIKLYPITENFHQSGILKRSVAPIENIKQSQSEAIKKHMSHLLESWNYIGVIAMELFVTENDVMVNELAPRVHNSGHWTWISNSSITSQFENHVRAITGDKLGETKQEAYNGMVNVLGSPKTPNIKDDFEGELRMYGKSHRLGRKMGHINFADSDRENLLRKMEDAEQRI